MSRECSSPSARCIKRSAELETARPGVSIILIQRETSWRRVRQAMKRCLKGGVVLVAGLDEAIEAFVDR